MFLFDFGFNYVFFLSLKETRQGHEGLNAALEGLHPVGNTHLCILVLSGRIAVGCGTTVDVKYLRFSISISLQKPAAV